jgi:hypothetical protein
VEVLDFDKHFKLMADIDLSGYTGTDFHIIGDWNNPFTGVLDGNGHTISNFTYTSTEGLEDIGLFASIGFIGDKGEIKDLGLINPNVHAGRCSTVGSLVGSFADGTITNCYVEGGSVSGDTWVGGLAGSTAGGAIINCYAIVRVSGTMVLGGLVGDNWSTITNCYAAGSVSGEWFVGGLIGSGMMGEVTSSFWDIEASGQTTSEGGTGKTTAQMQMASTFTETGWDFVDETANGSEDVWWILEGQDYPRLWWEDRENRPSREPNIPPDEEPNIPSLSDFLTGAGTKDNPYLIYTAEQMNMIGLYEQDWDRYFKLMADIDLGAFAGTEFNVIGVGTDDAFGGVFDGNGKTISNFTYTSTKVVIVGLFPYVRGAGAEIKDLGLIDPNVGTGTGGWGWGVGPLVGWLEEGAITDCYVEGGIVSGDADVGGLVGCNQDTIADSYAIGIVSCNSDGGGLVGNNWATAVVTNCYSAGSVSGNECVGGLAGSNSGGEITTCYSASSVTGDGIIGGLVGENASFLGLGTITNCYARGTVSGNGLVGGLVGENTELVDFELDPLVDFDWGTLSDSFWDIETSGQTTSDGGTGKTTVQMQMASTFTDVGWDFVGETANGADDIWWIDEGKDYPRLWSELLPES